MIQSQITEALTALAGLVFRYTEEEQLDLGVVWRAPDDAVEATCRLKIEISAPLPLAALRERASQAWASAAEAVAAAGSGQRPGTLVLSWRGVSESEVPSPPAGAGTQSLVASIQFSGGSADRQGELAEVEIATSPTIPFAAEHWRAVLRTLSKEPLTTVGDVVLLPAAECQRLLGEWRTPAPQPELARSGLLHELFERQADTRGEHVALVCGEDRMIYAELEEYANRLAGHLRRLGLGRGCFVGVLLPRSMDVYVAMLGCLKAGVAYVPLDPDYPADRVTFILRDCGAKAVVTTGALASHCAGFDGIVIRLDADRAALAASPAMRWPAAETGVMPADPAYVIYTSGTTGRPKGVEISHASATHLVRAEGHLFSVRPNDRVYQGFSVAFDASVEEIWLAFHAGARLVVGTREMAFSGPELSRRLAEAGVTIFSCVPTLLAMLDEDVPSVRLLILGGEACPKPLADRWCRPGRRVVNTYGPTEATVIATWSECRPNRPLTIGRPLPNYSVLVLDPRGQLAPFGVPGELHLGGVGLARGYLGRPELTREKFVANPFTAGTAGDERLYRTGDRVRFLENGELEFLGRLDTQVKLRGYRIELSEIETVLAACPGVRTAAVALREDSGGVPQLVGYVVPRDGSPPAEDTLKAALRERLPGYMVPARLEPLVELPVLPSGKVDRHRLPPPRSRVTPPQTADEAPLTEAERRLLAVWTRLFAPSAVKVTDDFFLDLGGHSLLAARMVSELRRDAQWNRISILDLYRHPTVRSLAAQVWEAESRPATSGRPGATATAGASPKTGPAIIPRGRHFVCGTLQFFSLYAVLGAYALQWLAPYLTYTWMWEGDYTRTQAVGGAIGVMLLLYPCLLLAVIASKWLLIGRYRPGRHPLWGWFYFRWWLVNALESAVPVGGLAGTPLLGWYLRLMGARVGGNVYLGSDNFSAYDLLRLGDDSSIGAEASLTGYHVEDGWLVIGSVTVGNRCFVGTRSLVRENAVIDDGAALEDLSMLPAGGRIPAGERWVGSPASRAATPSLAAELTPAPRPGAGQRFAFGLLYTAGVALLSVLLVGALFPGVVVMNSLNAREDYYWYLGYAPMVALSFVVLLAAEIAAVKWLLLGRIRPGRHRLHSLFAVRKWLLDQLMGASVDVLGPLYATIYLPPWYRLLGARIGRRAEISTASFISPDLLDIGEESFIADNVSLGAARVERGWLTLAGNCLGRRAFVGNSALLPPGTVLGENSLVGCLSAPPAELAAAAAPDASWLGSPGFRLPRRQASTLFAEETTFHPTRKLGLQRALIELARVLLPPTVFLVCISLLFSWVVVTEDDLYLHQMLLRFPIWYTGCALLALLFTVTMKWVVAGRYRPAEKPLWSTFVWRSELVNALHEHVAGDFLVQPLVGTPFLPWYFRLLGMKVGRRVYLETTDFTEFDLVTLGDEAALNADCTIQTHLFEDRVMKMSAIHVGAGCTVGGQSLVLYDTRLEPQAMLGDLSLMMKGEVLPADTRWEGIPAQPAVRAAAAP